MNPHNTTEPTTLTLQPPVAQPPRSSFSCDRHPQERFSGFCPSCLCERLAGLDKSQSSQSQSSSLLRKSAAAGTMSSTAAAALKAIFRSGPGPSSTAVDKDKDKDKDKDNNSSSRSSNRNSAGSKPSSSFLAELRRTKSFSASKGEGLTGVFEPQRKSCDVRVRNNTLFTLFNQYDARKSTSKKEGVVGDAAGDDLDIDSEVEKNTRRIPSASASAMVGARVLESEDNGGIEEEDYYEEKIEEEQEEEDVDDIRVVEEHPPNAMMGVEEDRGSQVKEFVDFQEEEERPMKDHIDLESQMKKPPLGLGGVGRRSFWSAASVFSKKLQKWGRKQKLKKWGPSDGSASATLPMDKRLRRRHYCETQSEVADYGFGRRSCDTDPRFSLDAARISFDDPRYSLDEPPRVSWDGYLMGRSLPPRLPPMVSVVEDDAPPPPPLLSGSDNQIPVVEVELPPPLLSLPSVAPASTVAANCNNHHVEHAYDSNTTTTNNNSNIANETTPGGSAQTREYYSDSCSRRRKSLDRSSSIKKKTAAAEVAEMDDPNFQGSKASGDGGDLLMDSNSLKDKDDCSETFQLGSTFKDKDHASVLGNNGDHKAALKKSRRWKVWNILGLIYNRRHGASKYEEEEEEVEDDDRFSRLTGVDRSFSSSWQEFRREGNVDSGFHSRRVLRSNSSVSSRNLSNFGGPGFGGCGSGRVRRNSSGIEANGYGSSKKKKDDEFVLEPNRSARYSPNNNPLDNGLSKFYLTPLRGSWRSTSANNRFNSSHSIARSVLRLY